MCLCADQRALLLLAVFSSLFKDTGTSQNTQMHGILLRSLTNRVIYGVDRVSREREISLKSCHTTRSCELRGLCIYCQPLTTNNYTRVLQNTYPVRTKLKH